MKILAIVIARKGSKRLKNKHHLLLNKKKIICHTLDLLKQFKNFEDVIVSTNDKEIIRLTIKKYSKFIPLQRSEKLSADSIKPYQVIRHVFKWYKNKIGDVDGIFVFQPTLPLRTKSTINNLINVFKKNNMKKSVISVTLAKEHPEWMLKIKDNTITPFILSENFSKMSQTVNKLYRINGLGYLVLPKDILSQNTLIPKKSIPCIVDSIFEDIDIDTKEDLLKARIFAKQLKNK